ncbi:protein IQ-DOMAIN 11-like [Rutidosis leptorrhynchoides]|uniref:protein IQ-DOMAIN 11-like n=1 Tax=Rutidosis leptorrhynchoides TaxID=125765 RepID=UPI003A9903B6
MLAASKTSSMERKKKNKSWINIIKRFLTFDSHSKEEKNGKGWWLLFGRPYKVKRLACIAPPTVEEPSRQPLTEAIAAAGQDSSRVTGRPKYSDQCKERTDKLFVHLDSQKSIRYLVREVQELSAIRIQTAFRGLLARKALMALKGIVKLQAIIRGRLVRRHAITTLKCLQSIVDIQTRVCAQRSQLPEKTESLHFDDNKKLQKLQEKIIMIDVNSQRWDDSIFTKEMADSVFLSKKEALIKRDRIREYWSSHRNSAESDRQKVNGRWRYWLEQWVDTQLSKSKELEDLDTILTTRNQNPREEYRGKKPNPRKSASPRNHGSLGNDGSYPGSPVIPTYMAATESAKAKSRSLSSPRIRSGKFDAHLESYSPRRTNRFPQVTCVASQGPQCRSPSLKSILGPIKSSRTLKDLSIDSDCSISTWDRQSSFR